MFGKFVLGWIGGIVAFIGILVFIGGLFVGGEMIVFGLILSFGGGFLKYLSSQAVTVENPVAVDTEANADRINTNQYQFNGEKKLDNETYQLYLVDKYDIKKNDTLQKYVLNNTPYPDLQEALKVAHNLETGE